MKMFLDLDKDKKILGVSPNKYSKNLIEVELEEFPKVGFDYYIDNKLLKSDEYQKMLNNSKINKRILELKKLLSESDYKAIKYFEGLLTEEEYKPTKELRENYRKEINNLEEKLWQQKKN